MRLLEGLIQNYPVDRKKILVTGYSKGAAGIWFPAARHSDFFSAALPVSGAPRSDAVESLGPVPFYVLHSRRDERVPLDRAEKAVKLLQQRKVPVKFVVLDGPSHFDVAGFTEPLKAAVPWIKKIWEGTH